MCDLAAVVTPTEVEDALDDALRRGLVRIEQLLDRLNTDARRRRASGLLRALISDRAGPGPASESVLETRLMRLLRGSGLPLPTQQHAVRREGRVFARLDFAYPEMKVALETDGYRWHAGKRRWATDLERRNALTALGWRVLHLTWHDIERDPAGTVARIASLLRA